MMDYSTKVFQKRVLREIKYVTTDEVIYFNGLTDSVSIGFCSELTAYKIAHLFKDHKNITKVEKSSNIENLFLVVISKRNVK